MGTWLRSLPRVQLTFLFSRLSLLAEPDISRFAYIENPPGQAAKTKTHKASTLTDVDVDANFWFQATKAKYEDEGVIPAKDDFDSILFDCNAILDIPACVFMEELLAAYPEAKVLATTRDVESWSAMATIVPPSHRGAVTTRFRSSFGALAKILDPTLGMWMNAGVVMVDNYFGGDLEKNGKEIFAEHYAKVRNLAPTGKYLEFAVSEGWGPLCQFLEVDIPRDQWGDVKPFPRVNDRAWFQGTLIPKLGEKAKTRMAMITMFMLVGSLAIFYSF
ncbi:hypothetical protein MMC13_005002 [Lambiella insularis]|nr:hypothetical protein [Lambiella insularis]